MRKMGTIELNVTYTLVIIHHKSQMGNFYFAFFVLINKNIFG